MLNVSIKTLKLDSGKVQTQIRADIKSASTEMRELVKKTTEESADMSRQLCPKDTGDLEESIKTYYSKDGMSGMIIARGSDARNYAAWVEYGTIKTTEQPFMRDPVKRLKAGFQSEGKKIIQRRL